MSDLLANRVFMIAGAAWTVAQVLKVLVSLITEHRLNLRLLVSAGGMPSSHATLVTGLATAVAIQHGMSSTYFAIAAVFVVACAGPQVRPPRPMERLLDAVVADLAA